MSLVMQDILSIMNLAKLPAAFALKAVTQITATYSLTLGLALIDLAIEPIRFIIPLLLNSVIIRLFIDYRHLLYCILLLDLIRDEQRVCVCEIQTLPTIQVARVQQRAWVGLSY